MWRLRQARRCGGCVVALLGWCGLGASAGVVGGGAVVTAGSNYEIDFNQELPVPFSGFAGAWFVGADLIHNPSAGPMIKTFESPITDTLDPILLDAQQPFPIAVRETFRIVEPPVLEPGASPVNPFESVYGWYEEVLTEGWQWVLPNDPRYGEGPLFGKPLITRDGNPHPSRPSILPAVLGGPLVFRPDVVGVEFARIDAGQVLGINKALVWVGTAGNRIWGDDRLDDGTPHNERAIRVWEHPTDLGAATEMDGDFNGDGRVAQGDLDLVLQNWGRDADAQGLPRGWFSSPAQGQIEQHELDEVLQNWGGTVLPRLSAGAVPEPAGALLLMLLGGVRRRRC